MTSNIVSIPFGFSIVQRAQNQRLLTPSKQEKIECLLCFLYVVTALLSSLASLITLKLLSATREAFALLVDSSQEVILHISFETIVAMSPLPKYASNSDQILIVWLGLLKSLFLSQLVDGAAY